MKKILSILLTMLMLLSVMCIAPVSAAEVETAQTGAPETLYLNAGVWDQAGAIFRAWVWGGSDADKWIYFSDTDGDGIYEAALGGTYTGMKVLRAESGSTEWTSWNDSGDQTIPTDGKNMLVVEDWSAFSWSTYTAPAPVLPGDASAYYLMGSLTDWATGQNMVYAENTGVVTTTLELELGSYELKIKKDSNWMGVNELTTTITGGGVLGGTDNVTLEADGGTYTFNFTIATKALEIVYTAPEVEEPGEGTDPEPANPCTVYFVDYPDNFTEAYAYAWTGEGNAAPWPGVKMELTGEALSENAEHAGGLVYSATFDKTYENIIFSGTNSDGEIIGQSADLTFEAGKYLFWGNECWYDSIADIEADWPYVEPSTGDEIYTVAGAVAPGHVDSGIFGTPWDTSNVDNDLVYDEETGLWSITYTDVAKTAETADYDDTWYEYKIVADHTWDVSYNDQGLIDGINNFANAEFDVEEDGSTVTIYFNGEYCWAEVVPSTDTPDEPAGEYITVYFQNNWLWSNVSVYFEGSEYETCAAWPGNEMDFYDNDGTYDVYYAQIPADASFIIFNGLKDDGSGNRDQTPNITEGFYEGICYYMMWDNGNIAGSVDIAEIFPDMGGGEGGEGGSEVEPTGSSLEGLSATLGGKIGYNLHYKISSDIMADETARLVVYRNDEPWLEIPVTEHDRYDEETGLYVFTVELAAKEMADSIASKVISDSYNTFFNVNSFSGYCSRILDDPVKYAREQDLVKALLNYGTASQVYFDYGTDFFANYWLSEADREVPVYDFSDYAPVIEGEADGIEFYGASLVLESDTYLKIYFKVDETKLPEGVVQPSITINGLHGAGLDRNGNLWSITFHDIAAHELSEEFVLSLGGQTVTYSANSYIYVAQQSGKTELIALANALGAYSNAAVSYHGE